MEERMNLLTAKEAARYLRVSMFTLSKIEREGGLIPYRTPGGHRRYSLRMLNEYLNKSRRGVGTMPRSRRTSHVQSQEAEQASPH
jgi:excisionase family DNA binding protein